MPSDGDDKDPPARRLERLETELAAARESEQVLRSLLDAAPDFIVEVGLDGRIRFLNRVAPGLHREDIVGSHIDEYLLPDSRQAAMAAIESAIATGVGTSFDSRGLGAYNEVRHYHTRVARVVHDAGDVAALLVASDVTELRTAHLRLVESEEKLKLAVDASAIGIWSWLRKSDTVAWDARTCQIFGVEEGAAALTVQGYLDLVYAEDRRRVAQLVTHAVETGNYGDLEHRIVVNDEVRWVVCRGRAVRGASGEVEQLVGAIMDITDRRTVLEQRLVSQKLEAVGQLAAGIAHNFNNMLAAILPNLELAQRRAPPQAHSHLEAARAAAERASRMVRQLVVFAGSGQRAERKTEVLGDVVARTVEMCRATLEPSLSVQVVSVARPAVAKVDSGQIEQVLLNLLLNARDACLNGAHKAGRVEITIDREAGPDGEQVVLIISDDGVGMPDDVRRRVFEPFFTTKGVGKGTGLGLATSYAIIRDHGGTIECDSAPKKGTTFTIRLPAADLEAPRIDEVEERPPPSRGSERVLVVDDEDLVRRVVADMLQHAGYDVVSAADGGEALEKLEELGFALMVLDLRMPGLSGEDVLRRAREISPRTRVVCFSGTDVEVEGADAILPKPVGAEELLETVRTALDR